MLEKIVVLLVVGMVGLMFFGNRLPQVLGDLGKGVRAFKEGMSEGNGDAPQPKRASAGGAKGAKKSAPKKKVVAKTASKSASKSK